VRSLVCRRPLNLVLAPGLLAAGAVLWLATADAPSLAQDSPAPGEKQVTLLYTVNNAGYTDVCG
jgi:hypothetical protein